MGYFDCKYQEDIETDYDIQTGHSWYETICQHKENKKQKCLFVRYGRFCKYREPLNEDKENGKNE